MEALKNIEDTAKDVIARVKQLATDREELTNSCAKARSDLGAAKDSLRAKKADLDRAMNSNRRNG